MRCKLHPLEEMVQLFSSWACDVCDGRARPAKMVLSPPAWMVTTMMIMNLPDGRLEVIDPHTNHGLLDPLAAYSADIILQTDAAFGTACTVKNRFGPVHHWQFCDETLVDILGLPGQWLGTGQYVRLTYLRYVGPAA